MKGKFMTTAVLLACLSKPKSMEKDIHAQLKETIAERKRILEQFEKLKFQQLANCISMQKRNAA